ncbi:MAG: DUF5011 domain-containing protein [Fibrobacter sp.]|nr:DUF5011 domain-containing protein [Fibrobacter sp.]
MKCLKLLSVFICLTVLFISNCSDVKFDNPIDANGTAYIGDELAEPWPDPDGIACMYNPDCPNYVKDTDPPIITLLGDTLVKVPVGDPKGVINNLKKQVKAYDEFEKKEYSADLITVNVDAVMIFTPGTYKISYEVTDKSGNTATAYRRVEIYKDADPETNQPPTIFIKISGSEVVITKGDEFKIGDYFGVSDDHDELTVDDLKIKGSYDVNKVGEYKLEVSVKDSKGLETKRAFTLVVEEPASSENRNPTITLKGKSKIEGLNKFEDFEEPGWETSDPDGDKVTVDTSINERSSGYYIIQYTAKDGKGGKAIVTRTITLKTDKPVITIEGYDPDNPQQIVATAGKAFTMPEATAVDANGKDITNKIITYCDDDLKNGRIASGTTTTISYSVEDDNGNKTRIDITVKVVAVDNKKPEFKVNGEITKKFEITLIVGNELILPEITAFDVISKGDTNFTLTADIDTVGLEDVDVNTRGDYTVTFNVIDAANNEAIPLVITVKVRSSADDFIASYGVSEDYKLTAEIQGNYTFSEMDGDNQPKLPAGANPMVFQLGWSNNTLRSFSVNYKIAPYYDDLSSKITHNFGSSMPKFTLKGAGVEVLDNTYYIVVDGDKLYWVQEDGDFVIIWEK